MNTASVPLIELFDFPSIRGLTEEFIRKHPGNIPVYGGKMTETPVGYIADNILGVKYFDDCLAWNREGSVGYVFYHKHRFSTNDHQRPLILKERYRQTVSLEYARIVLQQLLLSQGFVWSKTASKEKVKAMSIDIPINTFGDFDLAQQRDYVYRFNRLYSVQKSLSVYMGKIKESVVILDKKYATKTVYLSEDCFNLTIGKRRLKKEVLENGIPLYSANPKKTFGYVEISNLESFDRDSLIWGIDGNFQWNYIPKGQPFATTDHCGRLEIFEDNILSEYAFFQLRESSSAYGFNRTYRASLQNIKTVSIDVPVNEAGEYDIIAQNEMIERYKVIDTIKDKITSLIGNVTCPQVDV